MLVASVLGPFSKKQVGVVSGCYAHLPRSHWRHMSEWVEDRPNIAGWGLLAHNMTCTGFVCTSNCSEGCTD